ncbi:hypothetical protein [Fructilactobacillus florum]|nr:hypothetical protein [Fructilactobacillus florum]
MGLVIGYSIPIIPSSLVSIQAANVQQRFGRPLVTLTAMLGTFPVSLIYALGGNALLKWNPLQLVLLVLLLAIFLLTANWLLTNLVNDQF